MWLQKSSSGVRSQDQDAPACESSCLSDPPKATIDSCFLLSVAKALTTKRHRRSFTFTMTVELEAQHDDQSAEDGRVPSDGDAMRPPGGDSEAADGEKAAALPESVASTEAAKEEKETEGKKEAQKEGSEDSDEKHVHGGLGDECEVPTADRKGKPGAQVGEDEEKDKEEKHASAVSQEQPAQTPSQWSLQESSEAECSIEVGDSRIAELSEVWGGITCLNVDISEDDSLILAGSTKCGLR